MVTTSLQPLPNTHVSSWIEPCYASGYRSLLAGCNSEAERVFILMCIIAPKDYRGWAGLGAVAQQRQDWERAAAMYGVAASIQPQRCNLWMAKTHALAQAAKPVRAKQSYEKALEMSNELCVNQRISAVAGEL